MTVIRPHFDVNDIFKEMKTISHIKTMAIFVNYLKYVVEKFIIYINYFDYV